MSAPAVLAARVPRSKSIAQRVLVAAALARGTTRIRSADELVGADVDAARVFAAALTGAARRAASAGAGGSAACVHGVAPAGLPERGRFDVGESGTLLRLALAALALSGRPGPYRLRLAGTLARRESPALIAALEAAGARIERARAEVVVHPVEAPRVARLVRPTSSQEVSALLLALAARGADAELVVEGPIPSRPYVELTRGVLDGFGARTRVEEAAGGVRFAVRGPLVAPAEPIAVEPDASAAAVALAAGAIVGRAVRVAGLGAGSLQGDVAVVEHLRAFGAEATLGPDAVSVRGTLRRGARLDLADTPDLAPVAAALGAVVALRAAEKRAKGDRAARTELHGLETLPRKESSRIDVLADGLARLGCRVRHDERSLAIEPPLARPEARAPVLAVAGDHRMAFAFALVGLARPGSTVDRPDVVAKSWPGFWDFVARLTDGGPASRGG